MDGQTEEWMDRRREGDWIRWSKEIHQVLTIWNCWDSIIFWPSKNCSFIRPSLKDKEKNKGQGQPSGGALLFREKKKRGKRKEERTDGEKENNNNNKNAILLIGAMYFGKCIALIINYLIKHSCLRTWTDNLQKIHKVKMHIGNGQHHNNQRNKH